MKVSKHNKKKSLSTIVIFFLFNYPVFAEGQKGISDIFSFFDKFMIVTNIFVYTVIFGLLIKIIIGRFFIGNKRLNLLSFSISFLVSILLTIIFEEKFTYLLFGIF